MAFKTQSLPCTLSAWPLGSASVPPDPFGTAPAAASQSPTSASSGRGEETWSGLEQD